MLQDYTRYLNDDAGGDPMFNTIDKSDEDETPQDPTELKLARIKQLVNAIDVSDSSPTSPKRTAYM